MKYRLIPAFALALTILAGCGGSSSDERGAPTTPATNPDGGLTTDTLTAIYDPSNGVLPFPINLLLLGTTDLTLNPPVADPTDFGDPAVALSALDGFSTVTPWTFSFDSQVNATTVQPGSTVRLFEVQLVQGNIAVQQVNRELTPGAEYVTSVVANGPSGSTMQPTR